MATDIKLAHSIFALPFAILAAFMAAMPLSHGWRQFGWQLVLIVAAMICARTVAMLANRMVDRRIDRENPRTRQRALPSGSLRVSHAIAAIITCAVGFGMSCLAFGVFFDNWWPTILATPVLIWLSAYGFFKRFTMLCHVYLGSSLAMAPIAAALAIDPAALGQASLWWLSAMVLCWVAGFDVIYALQDVEVDRRQGLFSVPARLGVRTAMWISRTLHALAMVALVLAWRFEPGFGWIFGVCIGLIGCMLIAEHATVARWGTRKIAMAFFTLNGMISCGLGIAGVVDLIA